MGRRGCSLETPFPASGGKYGNTNHRRFLAETKARSHTRTGLDRWGVVAASARLQEYGSYLHRGNTAYCILHTIHPSGRASMYQSRMGAIYIARMVTCGPVWIPEFPKRIIIIICCFFFAPFRLAPIRGFKTQDSRVSHTAI